ncbi:hypothetical protein DPMN_071828 [Dreissena polymorpha]|uniref:Uncharacterized protein n=1 Tax=Dreissena polymorpha TaxID=45954 RepID=A0A9D3Z597_DREPO|nr:hypothetical protein DPMN_071828 [Dreissena polymorpha]
MDQINVEIEFREALLKWYSTNEKHLITKDVYNKPIDDLNAASETTSTKSCHQHYILKKYEVMQ